MADGSIPPAALDAKPEPTLHQRRAWECVQVLLNEYTERLGSDDMACLMDLAASDPASLTEQDMDDAMLAFEVYVVDRV